jgi:hypothetical protein
MGAGERRVGETQTHHRPGAEAVRVRVLVPVVAVRRALLVGQAVAIVVRAVAELGRTREGVAVAVVAVPGAGGPAVGVVVVAVIRDSIAVVVQ